MLPGLESLFAPALALGWPVLPAVPVLPPLPVELTEPPLLECVPALAFTFT
jgi:hypothetical protein